jgi:hypothetical protein
MRERERQMASSVCYNEGALGDGKNEDLAVLNY